MEPVLSSWKEIASYFGKGVRTVQRWEESLGLPVHRPDAAPRNIIFAKPSELDAWLNKRGDGSGKNVVLMLHDPVESRLIQSFLEMSGHTVIRCESLEAIRQTAASVRADVLLLDIGQAQVDSVEIANHFEEIMPGVNVIFTSSQHADGEMLLENAGATCSFLAKPYALPELMELIKGAAPALPATPLAMGTEVVALRAA